MLLVISVQKCLDCTMLLVTFYRKTLTKALKASTPRQSKQTASKLDSQEANSLNEPCQKQFTVYMSECGEHKGCSQ